MYPYLRMIWGWQSAKSLSKIAIDEMHVSSHRCWPQDIDMWMELNNGRTLTLYDLGRIPMAARMGLLDVLKTERWRLTVAGSVVRYRRRVRGWNKVEMQSRVIGWDKRFVYIEQSMWKADGECASQIVLRTAVTDSNGIVTTDRIAAALGFDWNDAPELPEWVVKWIAAEDARPWPPHRVT